MGFLSRNRKSPEPNADPKMFRETEVSTFLRTVRCANDDAWFTLLLNGTLVTLPRYTLLTMGHCVHFDGEESVRLLVEDQQSNSLWTELYGRPGVFIDVGAAAGTMTVPFAVMARNHNLPLRIFAFEPSRSARRALCDSIRRNGVEQAATVFDAALSDFSGSGLFHEFPLSANPIHAPFFPETSRLTVKADALGDMLGDNYEVPVERLDWYQDKFGIEPSETVVVKIDVEGFEVHVLKGGLSFLQRHKPYLLIELHPVPDDGENSEKRCREILEPLGYSCVSRGCFMECQAER